MFPTRLFAFVLVGLAVLFTGHGLAGPKFPAPDPPRFPEKEVMEEKRDRAHAILDALTAGDYDTLRREATALDRIADLRIFLTSYKTEEYRYQAKVFKHAVDDLVAAAKAKNMDAAALAYADMTRTCVKCHTHFRGVKD
ncbi:MAG: cytochrome c [Planctomycetes bacterium]|nr:cytochrome c [Planctomycetota bacterium]